MKNIGKVNKWKSVKTAKFCIGVVDKASLGIIILGKLYNKQNVRRRKKPVNDTFTYYLLCTNVPIFRGKKKICLLAARRRWKNMENLIRSKNEKRVFLIYILYICRHSHTYSWLHTIPAVFVVLERNIQWIIALSGDLLF